MAHGPPLEPSDDTLVAQVVALGDDAAFETLMRRHERRVQYLLRRFTRDSALAEELCQETFLRAWRKLATFQGRGSFGGWLNRLAYNVFLQHRRRHAAAAQTDSLDNLSGERAADAALLAPPVSSGIVDLDRLLAVIPPGDRELLTLTYAAGLSASEIGSILGIPAGTIKSQIHRAKQKIRTHFDIEKAP